MKTLSKLLSMECAKFCGSCGNVPSYLCGYFVGPNYFLVGILWVQNIFSWVFRGFKLFSRGYFVGPKYFLVGISWVQIIFSWVFLGPKYFLVGISWVQIIFSWVFRGSKMFPCRYFVSPKIFLVGISCARNFFSRVQNFPSWAIS